MSDVKGVMSERMTGHGVSGTVVMDEIVTGEGLMYKGVTSEWGDR